MNPKDQVIFLAPNEAESFSLEGVQIDQLLSREACRQFSAYLVRMLPHQIKKASYHKVGEELYYVVSGSGTAQLGDKVYDLKPGCFFRVPPKTLHQFATTDEPLELLNLHSPPVFSDHDTYFVD
jgi:mannose-6-phosphate isomerase-like protein (cupin superfamily)